MSKYYYKKYLHRAFWNSLLAVLCALVLVLIIVYGWQGFKAAIDRVLPQEEQQDDKVEADEALQLLESLRGENTLSEEEQSSILEGLRAEENAEVSATEQQGLLDSLSNDD